MISLLTVVTAVLALISTQSYDLLRHDDGSNTQIAKVGADSFVWAVKQQRWLLLRPGEEELKISSVAKKEHAKRELCLWPEDECAGRDDRIVDQLQLELPQNQQDVIKIFPPHAMGRHFVQDESMLDEELGEDCLSEEDKHRCRVTYDMDQADVVIFPNADVLREPSKRARSEQIWIAYMLESPRNTFPERYARAHRGQHEFNWTASYRSDSDIVTPYAKFVPHQSSKSEQMNNQQDSMIRAKTKKVAWFASNCHTPNRRLEFARELSKYIQVDIYGKCGSLKCDKWNQSGCMEMLNRDYKFYLAFENSNSPEYITEKLYQNALGANDITHLLVPVVMGPPRSDYERLAPPDSFIHVDDFGGSAKELAKHLEMLDSNDELYRSYFRWKTMGRFVDTKFMCRICLMAHEARRSNKIKSYPNLKEWYRKVIDKRDDLIKD